MAYFYQEQFNAGELGPLLRGRSDKPYYAQGLKTCVNFRPSIQGPAIKRRGTVHLVEVKDSSKTVKLVEFIFSEIDSYTLEFGDNYIRFIQGTTQVESGGSPYEIVSPYAEADLTKLKFAQLGDIMYISHPDYRPYKLSRIGATNWTIAEVDYQLGPVEDENEDATFTITTTGTETKGGTSTWTASSALFDADHVGSVWKIRATGAGTLIGYARMTVFTSSTVATFVWQTDTTGINAATPSSRWSEASWSGVRGYPRAVAFHEQRLFFAGTNESPLTVYGSVANSFENFDVDDASADDALKFDLAGRVNTIQWLISDGDFLVGGTYGGLTFTEFQIGDTTTPRARVGTSFGSSIVQGVKLGDRVVYPHSNGKSIYETVYDDNTFKYQSIDLNDLNTEILSAGLTEMKVIEQPDSALACVSGGDLKIISRDRTQEVTGWYNYTVSGEVESVSVIPTTGEDRIYIVVKRTIDGATKRYIEYFDTADVNRYVDSSIYYSGSATRSLSGLDHLEGETVSVLGDGSYAGLYEVISGSITIPDSKTAISEAYIGLPYNADLETMPISLALKESGGSTQTLKTKITKANLILYKTTGLKIGDRFDRLDAIPFRSTEDEMTRALPLFGATYPDVKENITFYSEFTYNPVVCIRSDLPFPCTVISFMCQLGVNG